MFDQIRGIGGLAFKQKSSSSYCVKSIVVFSYRENFRENHTFYGDSEN
jgi:hypothetical protein